MTTDTGVVDLIERANDATPFCSCGSHTTPVWRDGIVWLDCAALVAPPESPIRRLLQALVLHVHQQVIDLPDGDLPAAA